MGLDISVYKVVKQPTDNFYLVEEHPELSDFPSSKKDVEFYDIKTRPGDTCVFQSWDEDVRFEFANDSGDTYEVVNPPIKVESKDVVYVVEVGYQRKGANKLFYEEDMWGSSCVTKKEILLQHWDRYFSTQTPRSSGGWGSSVEYNLPDSEMRENFKRNIIDNFVQGETFVVYH